MRLDNNAIFAEFDDRSKGHTVWGMIFFFRYEQTVSDWHFLLQI